MPMNNFLKLPILLTFTITVIFGCTSGEKIKTLRSIDIKVSNVQNNEDESIKSKTSEEIRSAYNNYLTNTSTNDISRKTALKRLTELEFEVSNKIDSIIKTDDIAEEHLEKLQREKLLQTINLLNITLTDYPKANDKDKTLYQLAKAYDQNGEFDKSVDALTKLISISLGRSIAP